MSIQGPSPLGDAGAPTSVTNRPVAASPSLRPGLQPDAPPSSDPAATATVSPWAEVLSKLQHLQQSNLSVFKRVTAQMADTVESQAQKAGGADAKALSNMSAQLKQASKTGSLPVFKPTHHLHHARTQSTGSPPSLLQVLLAQVDHVLGPGATTT